ncbi:MAG TPA: ribonuclease P protein component [Acidimicrobiia bacterium]|nr:ribonuclease P protein component [Acidimicrobiia bacterium]
MTRPPVVRPVSLKNRADFRRVLDTGRRRKVGGLLVVRSPGEPDQIRIGLVAGKRIGNAVQRNRIRRRLRAAAGDAEVPVGFDYVLIPEREAADVPYPRLVEWVTAACRLD